MIRILFLFACLVFFACSDESLGDDLLDGTNYVVSEKEDCDGIEYNPKIQFCSKGIIKDKGNLPGRLAFDKLYKFNGQYRI